MSEASEKARKLPRDIEKAIGEVEDIGHDCQTGMRDSFSATGVSIESAVENVRDAMAAYIDALEKQGEEVLAILKKEQNGYMGVQLQPSVVDLPAGKYRLYRRPAIEEDQ